MSLMRSWCSVSGWCDICGINEDPGTQRLSSRSRCISSEAVQEFHIICDEKLIRSEHCREPGRTVSSQTCQRVRREGDWGPELARTLVLTPTRPLIGHHPATLASDWSPGVSVTGPDKIFLIHFMTSLSRNSFGCQSTCRMQKHCRKSSESTRIRDRDKGTDVNTMMLGRCLLLTMMH